MLPRVKSSQFPVYLFRDHLRRSLFYVEKSNEISRFTHEKCGQRWLTFNSALLFEGEIYIGAVHHFLLFSGRAKFSILPFNKWGVQFSLWQLDDDDLNQFVLSVNDAGTAAVLMGEK